MVSLSMLDLLLLKVDVSGESDESQTVFPGVLVAGHVLMIVVIVVEVVGICYASGKKRVVGAASSSESSPGLRPRAGSDDVPALFPHHGRRSCGKSQCQKSLDRLGESLG
ncbi:unnamed protein product [Ectocarpus sp. 6 AP-2014]